MEIVVTQHFQATGFFQKKLQELPLTVYTTVDGAHLHFESREQWNYSIPAPRLARFLHFMCIVQELTFQRERQISIPQFFPIN
jgi:hypothetical protein